MSLDLEAINREYERMRKAQKEQHPPHVHAPSGWRCLVAHEDNRQCDRCAVCGEYFR